MRKLIFLILLSLIAGTCICQTTEVSVPHLINYQGRLSDSSGNPLTGSYNVTFRIYDALTAGNLIWSETQNGVVVNKGLFCVLLGSVTSLNAAFNIPYYLEIQVGSEVMSPRQQITSAGYAIRAEKAESADALNVPGKVGTMTVDETGIGDGKILTYRASNGKLNYELLKPQPGDNPFLFADSVSSGTYSSYTEVKEIKVFYNGVLRIKFDMMNSGNISSYGRIYINGNPVGPEHVLNTGDLRWYTFSDDLNINSGDLVQLYVHFSYLPGYGPVQTRNFRICWSWPGGIVTLQ